MMKIKWLEFPSSVVFFFFGGWVGWCAHTTNPPMDWFDQYLDDKASTA